MAFSAKIEGDELVLRIPMNAKPERSASGENTRRSERVNDFETPAERI